MAYKIISGDAVNYITFFISLATICFAIYHGRLFPNDFIPVLEEYRLIHKLDRAIYEFAFRDLRAAMDAGKPVVPVSLNFSRLDFELMDAVTELDELAAKYRIPKELVHVEVTESALMDNYSKLNEAMERIKALGYSLWLDALYERIGKGELTVSERRV